ncbi:hypothetical protein M3Y95_00552400 [Aphelenchoides besseyi]|nr:hypothetical protein M3Y95_00552400 [Aphelenchoides besseyi]
MRKAVISIIVLLFAFISFGYGSEDEYRLLQDLRKDYDPVERPVADHRKPIDVWQRVILQQILDVDEKNQMITMVLWLQYMWKDYKMRWAPEEYGNITNIVFPPTTLWQPDVLLFNSADENFDARFPVNFAVRHTGDVLLAPPAIVKSSCTIDITWFPFGNFQFDFKSSIHKSKRLLNEHPPSNCAVHSLFGNRIESSFFDEQICFLKFGAWTYTGDKLQFWIDDFGMADKNNKIDTRYYVNNSAWELVATPAIRIRSEFGGDIYNELYFYIYLRRRVIYYGINWIIPSILFLLSNILGFSLPSECGEKITLQTTNLLSVTVFLGMVADVTPPTSSSVPFIGAFFALQMVLLGSSVIITVLVINISFRSPKTHRMSPLMRSVFLEWLPWLTLMTRPGKRFRRPNLRSKRDSIHTTSRSTLSSAPPPPTYRSTPYNGIAHLIRGSSTASLLNLAKALGATSTVESPLLQTLPPTIDIEDSTREKNDLSELLRNTLVQLSEFLRISKRQMIDEEEEETEQADWRFMAMAIDRACMFIYAFLSFVIPFCMYIATPKDRNSFFQPSETNSTDV